MKDKVFSTTDEGISYYSKKIERLKRNNVKITQTGFKGLIARFNILECTLVFVFSFIFSIIFNLIYEEEQLVKIPTIIILIIFCVLGTLFRKRNVDLMTQNNNMKIGVFQGKIETLKK